MGAVADSLSSPLVTLAPDTDPIRGVTAFDLVGGGGPGGLELGSDIISWDKFSLTFCAACPSDVDDCANEGNTFSNNRGVKGNRSSGQMEKSSSIHLNAVSGIS